MVGKSVTITYILTLQIQPQHLIKLGGTVTIIQDVYQPTYNWGELIQQLLEPSYFKHGIYH